MGCYNLKQANFKEGLLKISQSAFKSSGITRIDLPKTLTEIGFDAFEYCSGVSSVRFGGTIAQWEAFGYSDWASSELVAIECSDGQFILS